MEKEAFSKRLTQLRINKGVSARDMSLSIGQSPGYINNVENGVNLPSMTVFFYICEYLGISPKDFFDMDAEDPKKLCDLMENLKLLDEQQINIISSLVVSLVQISHK